MIPNDTHLLIGSRDARRGAPLDVLHVPGGPGQEALMEDQEGREETAQRIAARLGIYGLT